ncbi:MAG: methionine/alanine import family NSS transporter small subunit [Trueperella sp.]|nr:methionine/alanine import family NSS transporter small subunit [Trueperella sp.]
MTTSAIIMMVVALVTVWGGLIAAAIHVARHAKDYK